MKKITPILLLFSALWAGALHAQDAADPPAKPPAKEPAQTPAELKDKVQELERRLAELDETKADKAELDETSGRVEDLIFERDMASLEKEVAESAPSDFFQFWGFFDLTYNHWFVNEGSPNAFFIHPVPSFFITNSNIYFKSQMTDTLSALLELRLSFMPHGNELDYEYHLYEQNDEDAWEESLVTGEYTRQSSEVQDRFTTMYFRQGGIMMERIHLTYAPKEWLKIIAGRFLTPYGIWNVEHGSPVVIPIRIPYMQLREMVPPAQTGLQVFGRFFLGRSDLFLDYAVTLSNGHGPIEQVHDLDANKAVGLKLKGTYSSPNFRISLGGYGMYGKYTDVKKVVNIYTTDEGKLAKDDVDMPLQVDVVNVKSMDEFIVSADLLVEAYGLRLQSEYIWTRWDYSKTGPRYPNESLIAGAPPLTDFYRASNVGTGFYVLLAYELPLSKWLGDFKITPFGMYEYNRHDDTLPHAWITNVSGGINLKPSPFVTIKLEYMRAFQELDYLGGKLASLAAQMAVSF